MAESTNYTCGHCGADLGDGDKPILTAVEEGNEPDPEDMEGVYAFCTYCAGILVWSENAFMIPHSDIPEYVMQAQKHVQSKDLVSFQALVAAWKILLEKGDTSNENHEGQ